MDNQMITTNPNSLETQMTADTNAYCSFDASTPAAKEMLFNGMNAPDHRIAEMINQEITVKDIYAEMVDITDEETGEITSCPRIVIFNDKDESFVAVSVGVFSAVKKLMKVFGEPKTWEKPLTVVVKQIAIKKGSMLTLEFKKGKK